MSLIQLRDISKSYGQQRVLRNIDLNLEEGEQYVLQGASGSGKSTLLHLIGGLDRPTTGTIKVGHLILGDLQEAELAQYRNEYVGFIFQFHFLLSSMSSLENIYLPARLGGKFSKVLQQRVAFLAQHLGVEDLLSKYPFELSGGEQQRVNIIRALSLRPKILLCDEPTGNLDSQNSQVVIELIREMSREFQSCLLVVTHDQSIASHFHNRIAIQDGILTSC